jgi:Cellulose binding domain
MYMTWLEQGASNVDWWDEHNGIGTPSTVDGEEDYDDQGMFSNASNGSGVTEPAVDTPFEPYYAVEMLTKLQAPGDEMVDSTSSQALLRVHAVRDSSGNLNILIDNEDPSNSYTVGLSVSGFTASGTPTVYTLANNATSITSASGSSSSVTVAPYSLTVVHIPGSGGTGVTAPGAPGTPTVSNLSSSTSSSTSGTATLSWTASTAGTYPVASYDVYTSSGTLATTTTGTSATLTGLTIGDSYTYYVEAVDSHGNSSLPSQPVTFTVPPPSTGTACSVDYSVTGTWPGGFQTSVTVTNSSTTALSSWTLTWTFPNSGEVISDLWNGSVTQSGEDVTVTNASYNGTLAASGGNTNFGFTGTDTGITTAPSAFYLNGNICSNG